MDYLKQGTFYASFYVIFGGVVSIWKRSIDGIANYAVNRVLPTHTIQECLYDAASTSVALFLLHMLGMFRIVKLQNAAITEH